MNVLPAGETPITAESIATGLYNEFTIIDNVEYTAVEDDNP